MKYTKEDIEKAKQYLSNEGYGTGSNFTVNIVANLMAEYAAMKLSDLEKLQIAIEALEYYKKMRGDSRDWGMISIKIDEALKKIK